jgi:hypothetical protein
MSINVFGHIDCTAFNLGFFNLERRSLFVLEAARASEQVQQLIIRTLSRSGVDLDPRSPRRALHGSSDLPAGGEGRNLARRMPGESGAVDLHPALGFFEYLRRWDASRFERTPWSVEMKEVW